MLLHSGVRYAARALAADARDLSAVAVLSINGYGLLRGVRSCSSPHKEELALWFTPS